MKYCKSCVHFQSPLAPLNVSEYAKCAFGLVVSPVTGSTELRTQSSDYCITLRKSEKAGDCGADAKHFEERVFSSLSVVQ